jgi:hypothetical protein
MGQKANNYIGFKGERREKTCDDQKEEVDARCTSNLEVLASHTIPKP